MTFCLLVFGYFIIFLFSNEQEKRLNIIRHLNKNLKNLIF